MERLTESELQIMKCIWDANEQLALSSILKRTNERFQKNWKPQTASTFVARLVQKGFLRLDRSVRYYSYEVLIPEIEYLKKTVLDFSDFWGEGVVNTFVATLIENQKITDEEAKLLSDMLDQMQ